MSSNNRINEFVRMRIREIRKARKIKVREIAAQIRMPYSSYASIEGGFYKINLDNLFRILGALDVDIREVWPVESALKEAAEHRLYLQRIQEFRVSEMISLLGAEGAALFVVKGDGCKLLVHQGLSDFLLDRLIFYLEDGLAYPHGLWFHKTRDGEDFHFFIKGKSCPDFLSKLIQKYMLIWAELYSKA
ncbi:helix-turn-helix transcriptional regulator [Acidobacteria bacterium AH-259-D05]|nr:helix-turn-helix transcriptional regulator [Acidobacteria bacterium AH-259-D05]